MSRLEINRNSFTSEYDAQSDDILLHPTEPTTEFSCKAILLGSFLSLIPITTIVIGCMYFDGDIYCPIEKDLPLYLVIGGLLSFSSCLLIMVKPILLPLKYIEPLAGFLQFVSAAWFVVICVYVYSIRGRVQHEDMLKDSYCEDILYEFAFWTTTACLAMIVAAILIVLMMFLGCKCFVCNRYSTEEVEIPENNP